MYANIELNAKRAITTEVCNKILALHHIEVDELNYVDNRARLTTAMDSTLLSVQTVDSTSFEWFNRISHTTRMVNQRVVDVIASLWPILSRRKIRRFSSMFHFEPSVD